MPTDINPYGPDGLVALDASATHANPLGDSQIEAWSAHLGVDASVPGTPTTPGGPGSNLQT